MQRIKSGNHIAHCLCILSLIFVGHKTLVLPVGRIAGELQSAAAPDLAPSCLSKQILLILYPFRYAVVSRCKPYAAVWKPAVPAHIGIELVCLAKVQQNASLNASAGALCSAAIYILSNIIISVPALYCAAKERCSKIQVHPLSRILCREIESSVQNLLAVVGSHIISLHLVRVSAGKPCKRF